MWKTFSNKLKNIVASLRRKGFAILNVSRNERKIYIVFRHDNVKHFYYKEDVFDTTKTYQDKPVAIFYTQKDAQNYVVVNNYEYFNE